MNPMYPNILQIFIPHDFKVSCNGRRFQIRWGPISYGDPFDMKTDSFMAIIE